MYATPGLQRPSHHGLIREGEDPASCMARDITKIRRRRGWMQTRWVHVVEPDQARVTIGETEKVAAENKDIEAHGLTDV